MLVKIYFVYKTRRTYQEMNLGLIIQIDKLFGRKSDLPNLDTVKFINAQELLKTP